MNIPAVCVQHTICLPGLIFTSFKSDKGDKSDKSDNRNKYGGF